MKYVHPKKYKGLKRDTERKQITTRLMVEKYCLKCDKFMGKEHDFSECRVSDLWSNGKIIKHKTCPFEYISVPLFDSEDYVKCEVEDTLPEKKYKCIYGFSLEMCDDDGFTIQGEYITVEEGSLWRIPEDKDYRFIGGEIRLECIKADEVGWIEIPKDMFETYFEKIQ